MKHLKHLKRGTRAIRPAELLPNPNGKWRYMGHSMLGGSVRPGVYADKLAQLEYGYWGKQDINIVLGVVALASAGRRTKDISGDLYVQTNGAEKLSLSKVDQIVNTASGWAGVRRRYSLLPVLLREYVFQVKQFGNYDEFQATPYELAQLGLIARGVGRSVIAQACQMTENGVRLEVSRVAAREGLEGTAGCISGAILTRHLGATSCVPLLAATGPRQVRPLMEVEAWDELIEREDVAELTELMTGLVT